MKYIYLCFSRRQSWYGKEIKSINQSHKKRDNWGTLFCLVPPVYQKADIFEIDFPSFVNYSQCQRECVADFRKPMLNLIEFVIWRKKWPRSLWQSSLFDRPRLCPSQYTLCYNYLFKAKGKKGRAQTEKRAVLKGGEKGIGGQTPCTWHCHTTYEGLPQTFPRTESIPLLSNYKGTNNSKSPKVSQWSRKTPLVKPLLEYILKENTDF